MAFLGFKEILELIEKVAESGISSVEVESAGVKVRIEGNKREFASTYSAAPELTLSHAAAPVAAPARPAVAEQPVSAATSGDEVDPSWHIVTSPIVGTFYRSPNPEAEPFANVGDRVSKGQVLCIIEAMKLMNEIESDGDGIVAKIFPQNGQPIEYGEKLFALKS